MTRITIPLINDWLFIKTAENALSACTKEGETISLPHTWNALDGQDGGNDYHRGTCYYVKKLSSLDLNKHQQAYLEFEGAAMIADVYVNGQHLTHHEGGYSTFRVNITSALDKENTIVVALSNSSNQTCYPQKADFTFYGGLYRMVHLIIVPDTHFELEHYGTSGIKVTPIVDLKKQSATVIVETMLSKDDLVTFHLDGQRQTVAPINKLAKAEFTISNVHLWDGLKDPYLYTAVASLPSGDMISTRFGCREFHIDPQKGFFLNGRSYPLRGVSRHQDAKDVGNALALSHHKKDMEIILELGATTLRLAHYQHAQEFYDLCDEYGLILWAEIPYITMHMSDARENALSQMKELVIQNYNHPSIITWGLSNEITAASPVNDDLLTTHQQLNDLCHELDFTRPTCLANVFMLEIDSPILSIPDINSYNLYFGWYLGDLEQNDEFFDEFHEKYPDKVIGFSEYGADANPQFQSPHPEKGDYTESYQALYHEHMLELIEQRPYLWATHVWNLFDFAADGRDEGGKHGENQKGLVTIDRNLKKDAFYLYKAAWNKTTPFVHLCGRRYIDRNEKITEVKVYSNQPEVTLFIDGAEFATVSGKTIFRFQVPIKGEHILTASSSFYSDSIFIRFVEQSNPDYAFIQRSSLTNWFDADELDPDCYSIHDRLEDIRKHPKANAIITNMMAQGASKRGDVADAVQDNPALVRMMGRMTLISLLKQGGAEDESIQQLQRVLQGIKKEQA